MATPTGSSVLSSIWTLLFNFFQVILGGISQAFSAIFQGFAQSIVIMFQGFGFSLSGYGIYGPLMFIFGLGIAILVAFLFFAVIGPLRDITSLEDDV